MKTRIVHTRIWEDEFFIALSQEAKLLFLYLITNQRINLVGCYQVADRILCFDIGLSPDGLSKAKTELGNKVKFAGNWVYIPNAAKLGGYSGKRNEIAFIREFSNIPQSVIDYLGLDTVSINPDTLSPNLDTPINHKSEIINNKSEIINQKQDTVSPEVVERGMNSIKETLREKGLIHDNT
jgi:hypothetical protein